MLEPEERRLLVIASQCPTATRTLPDLDTVARELDGTLREFGDCAAGLRDGRSLLCGTLTAAQVRDSVNEAIAHCATTNAVLILAFLGHAFIPGQEARLFFMVEGSQDQDQSSAVDLTGLIAGAADHPKLGGTLVVADTCHAGAAAHSAQSLVTGACRGRARLSMLLAAPAPDAAFDLALSRGLVTVLRGGVPSAEKLLGMSTLKHALEVRNLTPLQDLGYSEFDGVQGSRGLWLARNRLAARLSPLRAAMVEELAQVVGPIVGLEALPSGWDRAGLRELRARLQEVRPVSAGLQVAQSLVSDLEIGLSVAEFLRTWLGAELMTDRLLRGLAAVDRPLWQEAAVGLDDAIGHLVLNYPAIDGTCGRVMARYVAALSLDAGRDPLAAEPQRWADSMQVTEHLNDAAAEFRARSRTRRLRLIISLHGSITGHWPSEVAAWLQEGDTGRARTVVAVSRQTEAAVGDAVKIAARWGSAHARGLGEQLGRIEIVAPENLLLTWHPEEVKDGQLLGVRYDVALRWSRRLAPPEHLHWINDLAWSRLTGMENWRGRVPADWLSRHQTEDLDELEDQLSRGVYDKAVCVDHAVPDARLLALLLAHSPVVLWPRDAKDLPTGHRQDVQDHWHRLPDAVGDAYRLQWSKKPVAETIAALRTVWDDKEWLRFCERFTPLGLDTRSAS